MDGIAIKSATSALASESHPILIKKEDYQYVDTGDVISKEWDAVVMIEDVIWKGDDALITKSVGYFDHVRPMGEDISQTQMIIPSFHRIRAVDLGPLMASKNETVEVFKKLKTAILPTGSEIVDVSTKTLEDGMIIDSNSSMIQGLTASLNLDAHTLPVCSDDYQQLKDAINEATKANDVLLINAGSSAGSEDYTVKIVEELGQVSVHGIAIKPGKPAILGLVNEAIVIGLPGYPVSTYVVFEQVFKPLINRLFHQKNEQEIIQATLTKTIYSSLKHLEFVRVKVGYLNDQFVCTPLARGAGISMSLAEADGMVVVPKQSEGYQKNNPVTVQLFKPSATLKNKITSIGSHDLILDVLNDVLNQQDSPYSLSSSHVGSYSGLLALKSKETLMAPIHLLAEDGTYNEQAIKTLFKGEKMALIKGVKRKQVLAFAKGNPKNIRGVEDLAKQNLHYVNRQQGSGTAVLFDYLLTENGIDKSDVVGYDFVMPGHFNVGAAIKNGTADCGLLIKSIANVMALDYVEVMAEDYDFALYEKDLKQPEIKSLIETLKSDCFKEQLETFDCYDTTDSGQILMIGEVE
jgi:putative molybdopterin biosynthesis protein